MQYLLQTFSDPSSTKNKLSKVRHLESLLFYFLIIVLLFYQLFQNHHLKNQLINLKTHQMLQQLLQERLPQLQKSIDDLRNYLHDENARVLMGINESKELSRLLGRQLGLPLISEQDSEDKQIVIAAGQSVVRRAVVNFEVIQITQDGEDTQMEDAQQQQLYNQNTPQQEIIQRNRAPYRSQYLEIVKNSQQLPQNIFDIQENLLQVNNSFVMQELEQEYFDSIQKELIYISKAIFVFFLLLAVISMIFYKKNKTRKPKSSIKNIIGKICSQGKKRIKEEQLNYEKII